MRRSPLAYYPPLNMCYGYRGNGSSVFATIGGIARLMDQYEEPQAIFGTSSGSVAAFLTESVLIPNDVYECSGCTKEDTSERRSFMLKAFPLFVNALVKTDSMAYDYENVQNARKLYNIVMGMFFSSKPAETKAAAKPFSIEDSKILSSEEFQTILSFASLSVIKLGSKEVKDMINPDFYKISGVGGKANPALVKKSIENLMNFQGITKDNKFAKQNLMYPGVISFDYIFRMMGTVGDWYAGYGPQYPRAALTALLDTCAKDSRSLWWNDLAQRKYGTSDCGKEYFKLFSKYFNERRKAKSIDKLRVLEPIGAYVPSFVSTSSISGNTVVKAISAAADAGKFENIDQTKVTRENFKVLYFGPKSYQGIITNNKKMFDDVITNNIVSMGSLTWLDAMKASGQEPATARAGYYEVGGEAFLATGGFVDQLQSKLMRMVGCEQTVAINNNKPILDFANRYAPRIWDDATLVKDILEVSDNRSAESMSFKQIDALLCARWGIYGLTETWEMADNSYHQIIYTKKPELSDKAGIFKRKNGVLTTEVAAPLTCYSQEDAKNNQFEAYQLEETAK